MSETTQAGRKLTGEFLKPRNTFQDAQGSIHNDAVASKLGFKGGTVPGSIHMDQFVPLLLEVYGEAWFETGGISLYFTQATVDAEAVRASVEVLDGRCRLRMHNEAGDLICEGTANVGGPDPQSELARRLDMQAPASADALRILGDIKVGDAHDGLSVGITKEVLDRGLAVITEPLAAYSERGILPPSHGIRLAHMTRQAVMAKQKPSVGLFGALEVQQLHGPLLAGVDYLARSRILKLTESPKTENVWYEITFQDPKTKTDVATVLYCLRFLKASSPLWSA